MADIYDAVGVPKRWAPFFIQQKNNSCFSLCRITICMFSIVTHGCQNYFFLNLPKFLDAADSISKAGEYICNVIHSMSLLDVSG